MNKIILICGKICSGKTIYAKKIAKDLNAVILSVDEITLSLFGQHLGDKHDEICEKIEEYLYKKALEILSVGINVILDWGFWKRENRQFVTKYFKALGINVEWHYIDVDKITWNKNIFKRNNAIRNNEENNYFIDENIIKKLENLFEKPEPNEIDICYKNNNENI